MRLQERRLMREKRKKNERVGCDASMPDFECVVGIGEMQQRRMPAWALMTGGEELA